MPSPQDDVDAFVVAVSRLESRLRLLGPRWAAARATGADAPPAVERVRAILVELERTAAGLRGEAPRDVPHLAEHALADMLVVLAHELVDAWNRRASPAAGGPTGGVGVVGALTDALDGVRRDL